MNEYVLCKRELTNRRRIDMRLAFAAALLPACLAACVTAPLPTSASSLRWTLDQSSFFPADRSLTHAEDGVVLADGTLVVGDWNHGLVALSRDGTKRPYGTFSAAGFETKPSPNWGSPNGISFEPDGRHILVADITTGAIYRVDTATEKTERIYDHPFGVNSVVRDSSGAIWFTQSTENPSGAGSEARMFAAVEGMGDGAVYRIASDQVGKPRPTAERKVSGLDFANGIAFDEKRRRLYVAEIVQSRILSFAVDISTGELSDRQILAEVPTPDNLELSSDGQLWVASPFGNEVLIVDPDTGQSNSVFRPTPQASALILAELRRRQTTGEPILSLLGPNVWGPMPGLLTGIILSPNGGPVYVSGLGDTLIKLDRF